LGVRAIPYGKPFHVPFLFDNDGIFAGWLPTRYYGGRWAQYRRALGTRDGIFHRKDSTLRLLQPKQAGYTQL